MVVVALCCTRQSRVVTGRIVDGRTLPSALSLRFAVDKNLEVYTFSVWAHQLEARECALDSTFTMKWDCGEQKGGTATLSV